MIDIDTSWECIAAYRPVQYSTVQYSTVQYITTVGVGVGVGVKCNIKNLFSVCLCVLCHQIFSFFPLSTFSFYTVQLSPSSGVGVGVGVGVKCNIKKDR